MLGKRLTLFLAFTFALTLAAVAAPATATSHPWSDHVERPPIVILDDTMFTPAHGVVAGSGTAADPYVIAGWEIDGSTWAPQVSAFPTSPFPPGIFIQGTTAHVVIEDNVVRDNPRSQVWVRNAEHVTVRGNLLERTGDAPRRAPYDDGVTLENVQDVAVEGNVIRLAGAPQGANGVIAVQESASSPELRNVVVRGNTVRHTGTVAGTFHGVYTRGGQGVTVEANGIALQGSAATFEAVHVLRTVEVRVADHVLQGPGEGTSSLGLRVVGARDAEVVGNRVEGFGTALHVEDAATSRVAWNDLAGSTWGLRVAHSMDLTLEGNTMTGNTYGFSLRGGNEDHYRHAVAPSNTVEDRPVRVLLDPRDVVVDASNAGYLALVNPVNVTVSEAPAPGPGNGQGVVVVGGSGVHVDAGDRSASARAVVLRGASAVRVTNLTGHDGLAVGGQGLRVDNSTLSGGGVGLRVVDAGFVRVENTTLTKNDVGVLVERSTNVDLATLEVKGNLVGVSFQDSTGTLHISSVAHNHEAGAEAVESSGGTARLNATDTWWGSSDGPSGLGSGSGDVVRTRGEGDATLLFDPWLTSEPAVAGR